MGFQWHRHWRVSFNWPSPSHPWHAHRDRVAEVATTLGLLVGTLGKIARDISLHMQTEIAEVSEPVAEGRGALQPCPQNVIR